MHTQHPSMESGNRSPLKRQQDPENYAYNMFIRNGAPKIAYLITKAQPSPDVTEYPSKAASKQNQTPRYHMELQLQQEPPNRELLLFAPTKISMTFLPYLSIQSNRLKTLPIMSCLTNLNIFR